MHIFSEYYRSTTILPETYLSLYEHFIFFLSVGYAIRNINLHNVYIASLLINVVILVFSKSFTTN